MRITVDTVGFVRALLAPFGPWGEILFDRNDAFELVSSTQLTTEIEDTLGRPVLASRFSTLPGRDRATIDALLREATSVFLNDIPSISRDPDDDHVLATGLGGHVEFIATEDKDLLDLREYEGIRIVTGRELLAILRDRS